MRKYTATIVDDEEKLREVLKLKLAKLCPDIDVVCEASCAETALSRIQACDPEIVFLDISMPKGSGFDLLARLPKVDFQLIFVTGYNEYALQALKMSAVDYLLKPIIDEELKEAVSKAKERIQSDTDLSEFELLKHNVTTRENQQQKVSIPSMNSYEQVKISDIIRLEGEQRYTRVYLADGTEVLSSYSIGKFKDFLSSLSIIDCHKSHLVNAMHIVRYLKDGLIVMDDGAEVPVSRRKREEIKHQVLKLIAERK